jgi:transcription elongation factor SPT6
LREELKDLIDDNPIEDESDAESDASGGSRKRKKSDEEDELSDRLEDDDYDLIEENLGVKIDKNVRKFCLLVELMLEWLLLIPETSI